LLATLIALKALPNSTSKTANDSIAFDPHRPTDVERSAAAPLKRRTRT
jgi:hypothetical protein